MSQRSALAAIIGLALGATLVLAAGCATDSSVAPPVAPSNLIVAPLGGGAHLTWLDNSNDEIEFVIMRQQVGVDAAMQELASVPFNGTQFHDEPVVAGATYIYQVIASNEAGETDSNQVMFKAPATP